MTHISTHVLDVARGIPAAGITVRLDHLHESGEWKEISAGKTGPDGRIASLVPPNRALANGDYRLHFATGAYLGEAAFYPEVIVHVRLAAGSKYHLPLLLSPFGFSTYRGS